MVADKPALEIEFLLLLFARKTVFSCENMRGRGRLFLETKNPDRPLQVDPGEMSN